MAAARMAFYFETGKIPRLFVLHRCDNPACVNPSHLETGTQRKNVRDMVTRGRHRGPMSWAQACAARI